MGIGGMSFARSAPGTIFNLRGGRSKAPPLADLLLNFNGPNYGQDFLDEGKHGFVPTSADSFLANFNGRSPKYGDNSLLVTGVPGVLIANPGSVFTFTGDFCVEGWIKLDGSNGNVSPIFSTKSSANNDWRAFGVGGNNLGAPFGGRLAFFRDSGSPYLYGDANVAVGVWNHIALFRYAGNLCVALNGVVERTRTTLESIDFGAHGTLIGSSGFNSFSTNETLNGSIDSLRVFNGYSPYSGDFATPSAAFAA